MKLLHVLIFVVVCGLTESLRQIRLGAVSQSAAVSPYNVVELTATKYSIFSPTVIGGLAVCFFLTTLVCTYGRSRALQIGAFALTPSGRKSFFLPNLCIGLLAMQITNLATISGETIDYRRLRWNEEPSYGAPTFGEAVVFKQRADINKASSSFVQEEAPMNSDEDVRVVSKPMKDKRKKRNRTTKKSLRKIKVQPRGGRHIKDTYQNLRSVQYASESDSPSQVTTETVVTLEPIYDKSSDTVYSKEELLKLCEETSSMGRKFGINDVSSFAGSNCALIRLYYPEVTCEQINVFMQYCHSTTSVQ